MSTVPENDWKTLRKLKEELLATACENVFRKVDKLSKSRSGSEHETHLKIWDLVKNENSAIAEMFDDLRRSNALFKITALRRYGVLTDEHLNMFTQETQIVLKTSLTLSANKTLKNRQQACWNSACRDPLAKRYH